MVVLNAREDVFYWLTRASLLMVKSSWLVRTRFMIMEVILMKRAQKTM